MLQNKDYFENMNNMFDNFRYEINEKKNTINSISNSLENIDYNRTEQTFKQNVVNDLVMIKNIEEENHNNLLKNSLNKQSFNKNSTNSPLNNLDLNKIPNIQNSTTVISCNTCKFTKDNLVNVDKNFVGFLSKKMKNLIEYTKDPNYQMINSD